MSPRHTSDRRFGPGPLLWLGSIGFFALLALVVAGFAVWALATGPSKHEVLVERGILMHGEPVHAVADLSPARDMSEGCVVTPGRAMSWRGAEIVASAPLAGSSITVHATEVTIHGAGQSVVCRFRDVDGAERFADDVAREALRTRPQS